MCFSLLHFPNGTVGDGERSGHRAIFRVAGLLKSACSSWLFLQFVDFVHPCPQAGPVRAPTEKTVAGIRTAVTLQRMAANRRRQRHLLKAGNVRKNKPELNRAVNFHHLFPPTIMITVESRILRRTLVNGRCKRSGHSYSHSAGTKPTKPTLFADAHSSMSYALANSTGSREPSDRRYTSGQGLISVWLSPR